MSKRILLAEASEAIRGVAEPVLRRNGFEVIAVPSAERAWGVLELSQPDLIVVGADLTVSGGRPFHEKLRRESHTQSIPLLVITQPGSPPNGLSDSNRIDLPLQPKAFLERVSKLAGSARDRASRPTTQAPGGEDLDGMVDAALGLDQIEVTESEVMDETTQVRLRREGKSRRPMAGEGLEDNTDDDLMRTGRVEIVNIDDEHSDIVAPKEKSQRPPDPSASGKLEILSDADQYAMQSPEGLETDGESENHDYEWFMKELQKEASGHDKAQSPSGHQKPTERPKPQTLPPEDEDAANRSGGVAEFIDEFKKEVEKIHQDEADRVILQESPLGETESGNSARTSEQGRSWEDTLDRITPEEIQLFRARFVRELADRIAERIVARIDPDKLLRLIRNELVAEAGRRQQK